MPSMRLSAAFPVSRLNAAIFVVIFSAFACSNPSSNSDAGGTGGVTASGGAPGTGGNGGARKTGGRGGATGGAGGHGPACGSVGPCSTDQVCVQPGCGGGPAVCERLPDGGQCPSGWTYTDSCATGVGPGCTPPPCTPAPPFCADLPAACAGTATCGCLPANVCQQNGGSGSSDTCQFVTNTEVICGSA